MFRIKRCSMNYLFAVLMFLLFIGEFWYQAEMHLYGYTQESLVDFVVAVYISKTFADYFVREE